MKIKISYDQAEEKNAAATVAALRQLLPGARIRRNDRPTPYRHLYISTAKPPTEPGKK